MSRAVKYNTLLFLLTLICCASSAWAQQFDIIGKKNRVSINFKLIRSMVVVPLKINSKGPYNFILDTGVGLMLITDHKLIDSLNIANKRTITIAGLGERDNYEAVIAPLVNIDIAGKLVSRDVSAAILKEDFFGLSNYAGIPIHGLLGADFFKKLAVKISFVDSTLVITRPGGMHIFRGAEKIPITVEEGKPYIKTQVTLTNGNKKTNKLLVDLGAGHPVSLEKITTLPQKSIKANLGVGLNGLIDGHLGRISSIALGKYNINSVIASFPSDDPSFKISVQRDGSIGVGILKRFDIIFDYQNNLMYLKSNMYFKLPFEHDMTGISYHANGENFEHLIVEKVDEGSVAEEMGIQVEDEIVSINLKPVGKMNMQQIDDLLKSRDGRTLLLELYRDKTTERVLLTLKRRI
ncbi:aspartyl protease family protein [Mucilaginibacter calamicampi]|uniref:Aspartyl protease family protein n=1 Tax=Mucilaginibacter calamicampi TaxID=1302352 RepID=A0ABW2Z2U3_9SPHI